MDTQTKITFTIKSVYRKDGQLFVNNEKQERITIEDDEIIKVNEIEFDEYKQVFVRLESKEENVFLEIDSSTDTENRKIINNNEEEEINPGGSSSCMLVPGIYGFKVYINNKVRELSYKILPSSNIEWESLINLRSYVEDMAKGLSYDFNKEKMSISTEEKHPDINMFDRYSKLMKDMESVINNINNIIRNPLKDLDSIYKEKKYTSKPDSKSQRWLVTKGIGRNLSCLDQNVFYERDVILTKDIIENTWIKNIIKYINKEIIETQDMFYSEICKIKGNELENQKKLEVKDKEFNSIRYKRNILQSRKKELKYNVLTLEEGLEGIEDKKQRLKQSYCNLEDYRVKLSFIVNNTWLKNINDRRLTKKPTFKMLKDLRYKNLLNVYRKLKSLNKEGFGNISLKYSSKLTSTLFEYYVLIHIMRIINKKGYSWPVELLNKGFNYISEMEDLSKEMILNFKGKDNDIEIAYDSLIKNTGSGFTIGSANHTRPDIRLSLYDKDGEIKRTIIVEVKCRDGKCVYHRGSKVEKQLRDYRYGFRYGEDEKDIVKQVIMICLITDNYKEEFEIKNRSIIGLPLEITNEKEIPRGYKDLVKNIDKFLLKD